MAKLRLQPPDPSISATQMSGQSGRDGTSSSALPPDSRAPTKLARCPRCSTAWGKKQRTYSTGISDEDRKRYDAVMSKFEGFFKVRKNLIFERARFNQRKQSEGESIEQYITALYHLVETCEYGDWRDEMLRDRLVVGIREAATSQKLQMDPELTLEKAMKTVRQSAAVKEQQGQLKQLKERKLTSGRECSRACCHPL